MRGVGARLAIADPPYPPALAERFDLAGGGARVTMRSRARRYYGDGTRSAEERPADFHPGAGEWDDPARHRALLEQLMQEYDGWAIATSPDGLEAYRPLPVGHRLLAWVKPTAQPTAQRLGSKWEPVIVYPPAPRRARVPAPGTERAYLPQIPDVLVAPVQKVGFPGAKPPAWTRWVLDALGYDPDTDELVDLFPGSGSVAAAASQGVLL